MHGERIVNEALRIVAGGEPRPTTKIGRIIRRELLA
jgi:hypothetical protein